MKEKFFCFGKNGFCDQSNDDVDRCRKCKHYDGSGGDLRMQEKPPRRRRIPTDENYDFRTRKTRQGQEQSGKEKEGEEMTPNQNKALKILLDAQGLLDIDTQLMPLVRFVLFGSVSGIQATPIILKHEENRVAVSCHDCGNVFVSVDVERPMADDFAIKKAFEFGRCPHCHAKFKS